MKNLSNAFRTGLRIAAFSAFVLTTGCTHYFAPGQLTDWPKPTALPAAAEPVTVSLRNAQVVGKEYLALVQGDYHRWLADLYLWTKSAVTLMKLGVEQKNYRVAESADKILAVSVEAVYAGGSAFSAFVEVAIVVTTGDGAREIFKGRRPQSAFLLDSDFDDALKVAVGKALDSKLLADYLTRPVGQTAEKIVGGSGSTARELQPSEPD